MEDGLKVANASTNFLGICDITPLNIECLPKVRLRQFTRESDEDQFLDPVLLSGLNDQFELNLGILRVERTLEGPDLWRDLCFRVSADALDSTQACYEKCGPNCDDE